MDRVFEDEFMEAQSRIVALCVEFAGNRADKVYILLFGYEARSTVHIKSNSAAG